MVFGKQNEANGAASGSPSPGFEQYLRQLIRETVKEALAAANAAVGPSVWPTNGPNPVDQSNSTDRPWTEVPHTRMTRAAKESDFLDGLISKHEAAAFLQVTIRTLEAWMKQGLPYYRIHRSVRFHRRHLIEYLDSNCRVSGPRA